MLHRLARCALLLTALLPRVSCEETSVIVFGDPDLSTTISSEHGELQVDAFKVTGNDRILQSKATANGSQLQWFSLGNPQLVRNRDHRNSSRESIFELKLDRMSVLVSTLTARQRQALAAAAQDKYGVDVSERQFHQIPLSSVKCAVTMTNEAGQQFRLTGNAINLQQFPIHVDFIFPQGSPAWQLLQRLMDSHSNGQRVDCTFDSKGRQVTRSALQLTPELTDQLAIVAKLFGPADAVYVTREQLVALSSELYSALSILHEYAMPLHQFSDVFVSELLKQTMDNSFSSFSYVDVDKALGCLSSYGLQADETSAEIKRALSSIFSAKNAGNRDTITLNTSDLESLKQRDGAPVANSSTIALFGIRIGPSSLLSTREVVPPLQSLGEQLDALNSSPESDVQWSRDNHRLVPMSIQVALLWRRNFKKTLSFSRIFREDATRRFARKVRMEIAETVTKTPGDSVALEEQRKAIAKLDVAVGQLQRKQANPQESSWMKLDIDRLTKQVQQQLRPEVLSKVEILVKETAEQQRELQEQREQLAALQRQQQDELHVQDEVIVNLQSRVEKQQQQLRKQHKLLQEAHRRQQDEQQNLEKQQQQLEREWKQSKTVAEEQKKLIREWEVKLDAKKKKGLWLNDTIFCYASFEGEVSVVEALLNREDDIDGVCGRGQTPLHLASMQGKTEVVKLLLQNGADINSTDNSGYSPLHWASQNGYTEIAQALIKAGVDINVKTISGWTPLHLASYSGKTDVVPLLIQDGADVSRTDNYQMTPLNWAGRNGSIDVVMLLIHNGADVNHRDSNGFTPLHEASNQGKADVVNVLLQNGADVNGTDNNGWTPLHQASWNGNTEVVKLLIQYGTDVDRTDKQQTTALYWASWNGNTDVVALLIQGGANVNHQDMYGWTALHPASEKGKIDVVKLLIQNGGDVNRMDVDGRTPLHRASEQGQTEVVRVLVQSSAMKSVQDRYGKKPSDIICANEYADKSQYEAIRQLLVE